ncbi:MAG: glycosyltransferase [Planctomycetota bacterium]|jgi:glycosyltransferase involved in cell wall biosynthesis/SAM-dependent methyltransferase
MRIGIDARALAVPTAGIAVYTRSLLREFASLAPHHRYFLYSTKPFESPAAGPFVPRIGRGLTARKGSLWMQITVPRLCMRDRIDLFWSPLQTLPVALPRAVPAVLTVHDFVQYVAPGSMRFGNWVLLRLLAPASWRRADVFLTGSRHSENLLRKFNGADADVHVIPHGPMAHAAPPTAEAARERVRTAFGVDGPYLLTVGTIEPRKNLSTLVRAVADLARKGALSHRLVVAGSPGWKTRDVYRTVEASGAASRVVFTGAVSDEDLVHLYAGADLFVFPSLYEGFGLPVLEAMALGVPVIVSRSSSLPEVVGDGGILFDPGEAGELAASIERVLSDARLRADLVRRGKSQASRFGWEKAASKTLEVFERAAVRSRSSRSASFPRPPAGGEAAHFDRQSRAFLRRAPPEVMEVTEPTSGETSIVRDAFDFLGSLQAVPFLDFGCGHGHNAIFAAREGASLSVGFDVSQHSLRVARKKARASGVAGAVHFLVASADRLPFKPGAFQRVIGTGILHHVSLEEASRELRRVLTQEDGRAVFTEPLGDNPVVQFARRALAYPRKARTPWERPLRRADVALFLRPFPRAELREYYLLTGLLRGWKGYFPAGRVDRADRALLDRFPPLRRLAAQVLLLVSS